MTTRAKQSWKPDSKGYYTRQIGWKTSKTGKLVQHKFILGTDLKEAKRREAKLRELWESFEATQEESRVHWPAGLLEIAKRVAKGVGEVAIPRKPDEMQSTYADRIRRMQIKYPVVCFLPADRHAFEVGQEALRVFESIPNLPADALLSHRASDADVMSTWLESQFLLDSIGLGADSGRKVLEKTSPLQSRAEASTSYSATQPRAKPPGNPQGSTRDLTTKPVVSGVAGTFHQALQAYQEYLRKEFYRPHMEQVSPWGATQIRQIGTLIQHHENMLLSRLDGSTVDDLFGYWRRRPNKQGTKTPMRAISVGNYIAALSRFLRWLHKESQFGWRKPEDFDDITTRVQQLPSDLDDKRLDQVQTFSLDELKLLMRYGKPFDRALLLLGLNCGFGRAEIASLLVREVYLRQAHLPEHQELLDCETTDNDSFVKRIRRKSSVYGEHLLFPLTVQALEWAIERRKAFPDFGGDARVLVNGNGVALDQPTKNGNVNQIIPNHFGRLLQRIKDDGREIRSLSFNKLRKTATQLIRRHSDGEIAGVFDCHGQPVSSDNLSDAYSNRPFGKVFAAIRKVEIYLAPVFAEAGATPFG